MSGTPASEPRAILHDYWRSSAAYRVRIALGLKGIAWARRPVDLLAGEQAGDGHRARNPQGLVPVLEIDGHRLTQSLAICDYLDAVVPAPPLVPRDPVARATVLAMALTIACDVHPLNNLRVQRYLRDPLGVEREGVGAWVEHWIALGFDALEAMAPASGWLSGEVPGLADLCLVPQAYNARRAGIDVARWPRLCEVDAALATVPAFAAAHPDNFAPD